MKPRLSLLSFAVALLLALGAIATACGDDGALSLEEYFLELEVITDVSEERGEALNSQLESLFDVSASDEERLAALGVLATESVAIFRDTVSEAGDLEPPDEAEEAHNEFLAAAGGAEDSLAASAGLIPEAESADALLAELFDPASELSAAFARFDAACLALQDLADENDIDVDLQC